MLKNGEGWGVSDEKEGLNETEKPIDCVDIRRPFSVYSPCKNGFPMTGACTAIGGGLPLCCDERFIESKYPDTLKPPVPK